MPESPLAPGSRLETFHLLPCRPNDGAEDELRYPVTPPDGKRLFAEIGQDHANLAPEVGIDGPGRIQARDTAADRQAAPGPDLAFHPGRNRRRNPRRDESPVV